MKVLLSGGMKTENILKAIQKKFLSSGDEFMVEKFIDTISTIYTRGEYFDKAIITEQSITKEFTIKDETEIRKRINAFAEDAASRPRKALYVFLTKDEVMANIIHEEIFSIMQTSVVVLKSPPYSVGFMVQLVTNDIKQLPEDVVYKPAPIAEEIEQDDEDFDDDTISDNVNMAEGPNTFGNGIFVNTDQQQDNNLGNDFSDDDFSDDDFADDDFASNEVKSNQQQQNEVDNNTGDNYDYDPDFDDDSLDEEEGQEFNTSTDIGISTGEFQEVNEQVPNEVGFSSEDISDEDFNDSDFDDNSFSNNDFTNDNQISTTNFEDQQSNFADNQNEFNEFQGENSGQPVNTDAYNNAQYDEQGYNDQQYSQQYDDQQYNGQQYDDQQYDDQQYDDQQYDNTQAVDENQQYDNTQAVDENQQYDNTQNADENQQYDNEVGYQDTQENNNSIYNTMNAGLAGFDDDSIDIDDNQTVDNQFKDNTGYTENNSDDYSDNQSSYESDDNNYINNDNESGEVQGMNNNNNNLPGFDEDEYEDNIDQGNSYSDYNDYNSDYDNVQDGPIANLDDYYDNSVDSGNTQTVNNPMTGGMSSNRGRKKNNNNKQQSDEGAFSSSDYEQNQQKYLVNDAAGAMSAGASGETGPLHPPVDVGRQKKSKGLGILDRLRGNKEQPEPTPPPQPQTTREQMIGGVQPQPQQQMTTQNDAGPLTGVSKKRLDPNKIKADLAPFAARGNAIVVSGFGGSGTSTVAYSLANIVCQLGYTVLLVDFDVKGRTQNYISKVNFESMETDGANLMAAVNSSTGLSSQISIVKTGFHLLTMGIGADVNEVDKLLHKDKLNRFINGCKASHEFVIYDIPFDLATTFFSEVTYSADNIVCVTDMSTWGITKMMLGFCNVQSEDMQDSLFNRAQLVFNKDRGMRKLYGQKVTDTQALLKVVDRQVFDLIGDDPGFYFDHLNVSGIIPDDPSIENGWFESVQYSDTKKGQGVFLELLHNIVLRRK